MMRALVNRKARDYNRNKIGDLGIPIGTITGMNGKPLGTVIREQLLSGKTPKELMLNGYARTSVYRQQKKLGKEKERSETNLMNELAELLDSAANMNAIKKVRCAWYRERQDFCKLNSIKGIGMLCCFCPDFVDKE